MTAPTLPTDALAVRRVSSPVGELTLVAHERGLRAVLFATDARGSFDIGSGIPSKRAMRVVDDAATQLGEYFAKERTEFDLPLDLQGTEFQLDVWQALLTIPFGSTVSYREQADRLGIDQGARAVGAANGKNPIPIIVPCHRVVGSDGNLTGYIGGTSAKAYLLRHEELRQVSLFDF